MADPLIEIAEAVKDRLNAGSWSQEFTAERVYDLTAELDDDGVVHVDVAVRDDAGDFETRGTTQGISGIDIAVRKKCGCTVAELDALMLFTRELLDSFIETRRLTTDTLGDAWFQSWERNPAYYPRHIRDFKQFTGMLTLQFLLVREIA